MFYGRIPERLPRQVPHLPQCSYGLDSKPRAIPFSSLLNKFGTNAKDADDRDISVSGIAQIYHAIKHKSFIQFT